MATRADVAGDLKAELLETMEMLRKRAISPADAMQRVAAIKQRRLATPDNAILRAQAAAELSQQRAEAAA